MGKCSIFKYWKIRFSGVGNPSAALVAGGSTPGNSGVTESFNGSSWTEVNDLTTSRNSTSQGNSCTQTASLIWGGYPSYPGSYLTVCESWNGSNWTEVNDLNYGQSNGGALGTQTAAISGGEQFNQVTLIVEIFCSYYVLEWK